METHMQIRQMTEADVEQISRLEQENFSQPWSRQAFIEVLRISEVIHLVAEQDGRIIGGAAVRNISGEGDITNVVVDRPFRGKGVATALLTELLRRGSRAGITAFTLEVRAGNKAAIHLYEKLGFVSEGIRPRFYTKPVEDALIMWKR